MNRFTRETFKRFSCKMIIDGTEYDCVPPDRGGRIEFLLMLDENQQDDLREKISTMDNIKVSCESVGISNGFLSDVKFYISAGLVITKLRLFLFNQLLKEKTMLEFRDGHFSENTDILSAFEKFRQQVVDDSGYLKALHVGSEDELDEIRRGKTYHSESNKDDLQTQINDLKEQFEAMKPVKSHYIHIPTGEERRALQDIMDAGKKKETVFLFD